MAGLVALFGGIGGVGFAVEVLPYGGFGYAVLQADGGIADVVAVEVVASEAGLPVVVLDKRGVGGQDGVVVDGCVLVAVDAVADGGQGYALALVFGVAGGAFIDFDVAARLGEVGLKKAGYGMPVVGAVVAVNALGAFNELGAESDGVSAQAQHAVDVGADLLGGGGVDGDVALGAGERFVARVHWAFGDEGAALGVDEGGYQDDAKRYAYAYANFAALSEECVEHSGGLTRTATMDGYTGGV